MEGSHAGRLAFCNEGANLIVLSPNRVATWDLAKNSVTSRQRRLFLRPFLITPDGRREIGWIPGYNRRSDPLSLADLESEQVMYRLQPPANVGPWSALALSPDGSTLVGGTDDGEIVIWRALIAGGDQAQ
jgi:hypothetical protein